MGVEWVGGTDPKPKKPRKSKQQQAADRAKKRTREDNGIVAKLSKRLRPNS